MPLTPADVHNIAFKKPSMGKRGYDEDQVDAFLDELEQELIRLIEENNDLRGLVERGGAPDGTDAMRAQLDRAQRDKVAAEQAAGAIRAELERVRARGGPAGGGDGAQVPRVLKVAQRTADDHVGEARREADSLLSEARSAAQQIAGEARAKADALERDARQRHQEAMGGLDAKRTAAQQQIKELTAFEHEYRSRLRTHVESQVRDLDGPERGLEAQTTRVDSERSGGGSASVAGRPADPPGVVEGAVARPRPAPDESPSKAPDAAR
jgi:DivIVA domain-containing protein